MIKPPRLRVGDKIAIVAPARKIARDQIEASIKEFENWGLKVQLGSNLFSNHHAYLSGTDSERLADLQAAVDDEKVKAIICGRGGYGSTRILNDLNFSKVQTIPKWIVGFSDITALHLTLLHHSIMSLHGTMPILFSKKDAGMSIDSLKQVLFSGEFTVETESNPLNIFGKCSGRLIGGNLSMIIDSFATASEPDTNGAILVLEEIDEYFYRLDRMMTQLNRAGKLKGLKGLLVGHFTDIKESELPFGESFQSIILDKIKHYKYPVAFNFPSGHENPNMAWTHGCMADLDVSENGTILKSSGLVL
jgi:muramoyltetrapeptide carboxypeptidase